MLLLTGVPFSRLRLFIVFCALFRKVWWLHIVCCFAGLGCSNGCLGVFIGWWLLWSVMMLRFLWVKCLRVWLVNVGDLSVIVVLVCFRCLMCAVRCGRSGVFVRLVICWF